MPNAIIHVAGDAIDHDAVYAADLRWLLRLACLFVLLVAACSLTAGTVALGAGVLIALLLSTLALPMLRAVARHQALRYE